MTKKKQNSDTFTVFAKVDTGSMKREQIGFFRFEEMQEGKIQILYVVK